MANTPTSAYVPEGASTNRPPFFDGQDYYYWKGRMRLFIESQHIDLWDIIERGPFIPRVNEGDEEMKPRENWTEAEKSKVMLNSKAKYYLTCALSRSEYDKVAGLGTAKEIWDTLQVSHEGTNQVKEAKTSMLTRQYELFKMRDLENIDSMFARFTVLTNDLKSLGKTFTNQELVRKILRSLPKEWRPKVTAITEAKDLSTLKLDELLGSLKVHEQELAEAADEENVPRRGKGVALKATQKARTSSTVLQAESEEDSEEEDDEEDDENEADELSFISRKIQKMWRKRKGKGRPFVPKRKDFNKQEGSSKQPITCYECKKPGHIRSECPQLKKGNKKFPKKKGMMATWEDLDEASSSDEEEEVANLCLMANEESESEETEVIQFCPKAYKDLEFAFDSLLNDSNLLAQKCCVLREKHHDLEKENGDLKTENALLKEKLGFLIKKNGEIAESSKTSEKSKLTSEASQNLEKENEMLKKKVETLTEDLAKFVNGTENLNRLLGSQKCVFDKAGLGFRKQSKQKQYKNLFIPAKRPDVVCSVCYKKGHKASVCYHRKRQQKPSKPQKANQKGPKKIWVPKSILTSVAEMLGSQKKEKEQMVPGQWMFKAYDRGQNQVPNIPRKGWR